LSLRFSLSIIESLHERFRSLHLFFETGLFGPFSFNLMFMLSLFETFDLPLIRAKDHSLNLVIALHLFRALIDSFNFLP